MANDLFIFQTHLISFGCFNKKISQLIASLLWCWSQNWSGVGDDMFSKSPYTLNQKEFENFKNQINSQWNNVTLNRVSCFMEP